MKRLSYEDRLKKFKLQNLVDRRKIGDLIQYFKINNGFDQFGNLAQSPDYNRKFKTRSHNQNKIRERLHKKEKDK